MKPGRLWYPLDVKFWDDPDTLIVGEVAAVLFLRLIAYAKEHQTDGWVPMAQVRALGGRRWAAKLQPIVDRGWAILTDKVAPICAHDAPTLAAMSDAKWCHIVAFLAWNDSSDDIEQRREIAREKKSRQRRATSVVPGGQAANVPAPVPAMSRQQETEVETEIDDHDDSSTASEGPVESYQQRVDRLLSRAPSGTAAWQLLSALSQLHASPTGSPVAIPGWFPSDADKAKLDKLVKALGADALPTMAAEWLALLSLIHAGEMALPKGPMIPYFAACLAQPGQLEARRQELGVALLPAREDA